MKNIRILHGPLHTATHTHQLFLGALISLPSSQDLGSGHGENEFILFKEVNMKTILANDISSVV